MRKRFVFIKVSDKLQFVEQTRAHFYTGISRMCALQDGTGRTPECLGASLHSEQGAAPLAPLGGFPLKAKGVTTKSHAFCLFYCLTNTPLKVWVLILVETTGLDCRFADGKP